MGDGRWEMEEVASARRDSGRLSCSDGVLYFCFDIPSCIIL
jgi:hypothetical protein